MNERADRLIALAQAQVGAAYVFGAWGGLCSPEYRRRYAGYTKAMAGKIRQYCPVLSGRQTACTGCRYEGRRAFDCRGLTAWCLRTAKVCDLSGGGATTQWSTASNWTARGEIDSLPELPGLVLFRRSGKSMAHTGLYIGGGRVVHAKGHAYGVVETALSGGGWTHWAAPSGLYSAEDILTGAGTMTGGDTMRTLRRGATGADVETLQTALVAAGQLVEVDGKYGAQTRNAVAAYQDSQGLTADGVCGPKTWAALGITEPTTGDTDAGEELTAEEADPPTRAEFDALSDTVDVLKERLDALEGAAK